jgi:hypothetical protein
MDIDPATVEGSMLLVEAYLLGIIPDLVQHSGFSTMIICGDHLSREHLVSVSDVFFSFKSSAHAYSHISVHLIGLQCI